MVPALKSESSQLRSLNRHNMIEERGIRIKTPVESKVKHPCWGTGGDKEGVVEYATERHIFNSENKGIKTFLKV